VWFRYEPDGSVRLVGAEPVHSEGWGSLKVYDDATAPTMTVNVVAGDPDAPTWTDLDVMGDG
jgi:hypothetical protein